MKKQLGFGAIVALVCLAAASARAQLVTPTSPTPTLNMPGSLANLNAALNLTAAVPPPADDPLLDANGNPVLDANGNPVSDPNEQFHQVKPFEYDPARTQLVQAAWLPGTGCPSSSSSGTSTAPACVDQDANDQSNDGLLLVKTGLTENEAAAIAELKKVRGITLTELGYDIRKPSASADPRGSHCGAGAPRFDVYTTDTTGSQHLFFIGCNSPPAPLQAVTSVGWLRLQWGGSGGTLMGFDAATGALLPVTGTVQRILIVFDEGQDTGPDNFGAAFLDNINVNGQYVGHGSTDAASR